MIGYVDDRGRSLLQVEICASFGTERRPIEVWIDTGFTGDIVLPQSLIDELQLPVCGSVDAVLADGSAVELEAYDCEISWFGLTRKLEIIANAGEHPLLGVGLLLGKELRIDYRNLKLSLLPVAKQT